MNRTHPLAQAVNPSGRLSKKHESDGRNNSDLTSVFSDPHLKKEAAANPRLVIESNAIISQE